MSFGIVSTNTRECMENEEVIQEKTVRFLGVPVYNRKRTSTNNQVMAAFTPLEKMPMNGNTHKVMGFGNHA